MDANGQPIGHAYAYYSSGEEDYTGAGVSYGGQVQHQYVMQNPSKSNSTLFCFLDVVRRLWCSRRLKRPRVCLASYLEAVEFGLTATFQIWT